MIACDGAMYCAEEAAEIIRAARGLAETLLARSAGYTNITIAMPEIGAALDAVIAALDRADVAYFQRLRANDNSQQPYAMPLAFIRWIDLPNRHTLAEHGCIGLAPIFTRRTDAERLFPGAPIVSLTNLCQP